MTESEWLSCPEPGPMLSFHGPRASGRKLRLFGAACCRRVWDLLTDERSRAAVEVAEQFADNQATAAELAEARARAAAAHQDLQAEWARRDRLWAAAYAVRDFAAARDAARDAAQARVVAAEAAAFVAAAHPLEAGRTSAQRCVNAVWGLACARADSLFGERDERATASGRGASRVEQQWQAHALRDLFCLLPFLESLLPFDAVTVEPAWLAWDGGTVAHLARAIYDDRAFERLPILGDALEEAGCTSTEVLTHCRRAGDHVRGCWVVDLLLA